MNEGLWNNFLDVFEPPAKYAEAHKNALGLLIYGYDETAQADIVSEYLRLCKAERENGRGEGLIAEAVHQAMEANVTGSIASNQPPLLESPVVVFPKDDGPVLDAKTGMRFSVTFREGGTAEMALGLIKQFQRLEELGERYGVTYVKPPVVKQLQVGQDGSEDIDYLLFTTQTVKGVDHDYLQFWKEGREFATVQTRKPEEIENVFDTVGAVSLGKRLQGPFRLRYVLGNLKDGKPGTKPWDFYWNLESIERIKG